MKKSVIIEFRIKVVPTDEVKLFVDKAWEKPHLPIYEQGNFKGVCLTDVNRVKVERPIDLSWIRDLTDVAMMGEEPDCALLIRKRE